MECHHFTDLSDQFPEELEALKARKLPTVSFSNIFGEEIFGNFYERIRAAGYHPETESLGAVVELRRPIGYGGTAGSQERVKFYIDWDGDGEYEECLPSSGEVLFSARDTECIAQTPVCYIVSARGLVRPPHAPSRASYRLRAILAWGEAITGPDFLPTWGDRYDCRISLDDRPL